MLPTQTKTRISRKAQITALALIVAGGVFVTGPAAAHSERYFERQLADYSQRIENGRISGAITFFEGRKLRRQLRRIERLAVDAFKDGRLSRDEHDVLVDRFAEVDERINAEASDRWRRLGVLPRVGI